MTKKRNNKLAEKPQTHTETYYHFEECTKWLEQKYDFTVCEFKGIGENKSKNSQDEQEYRDFWHWILEKVEMYNGMLFEMDEEWWGMNLASDDWRKQIMNLYMDEFGTGEVGKRIIKFRSCW